MIELIEIVVPSEILDEIAVATRYGCFPYHLVFTVGIELRGYTVALKIQSKDHR
jgi:hypothetical protein